MGTPLFLDGRTGTLTELFQLVQAAIYHADGLWGDATFDLYLKELPGDYGFAVAGGIAPAIESVLALRFPKEELTWLRAQPQLARVPPLFFESLEDYRFDGEIVAVPEGTTIFPGEPILQVTAPLPFAGVIGARLIQYISQASGVATRAARLHCAARGKDIIDFGSRRCAGPEAAWHATRAAWLGGCAATTNARAALDLGMPSFGVVSDDILSVYGSYERAYSAFHAYFPDGLHVNLPDGDFHDGVDRFAHLRAAIRTVRIDHANLSTASRALRTSLDRRQMSHTRILGSGSLDEHAVERLVGSGAPIDMFGVGQALSVGRSGDQLPMSYRMAELWRGPDPTPVTDHWSAAWPGRKQVMRFADRDVLCRDVETPVYQAQGGRPLLVPMIRGGEWVSPPPPLDQSRALALAQVTALPDETKRLRKPTPWRVAPSDRLAALTLQ